MPLAIANIERDFLVVGVLEEVKTTIVIINFFFFIIPVLMIDGKDDSGDGVPHARVPDWAWSALGGQSGDEDHIVSIVIINKSKIRSLKMLASAVVFYMIVKGW